MATIVVANSAKLSRFASTSIWCIRQNTPTNWSMFRGDPAHTAGLIQAARPHKLGASSGRRS